jgi:hypothetical protein
LAVDIDSTRAMFVDDSSSDCLALHVAGPDLVWRVRYDLLGMENPLLDQSPDHVIGHAD